MNRTTPLNTKEIQELGIQILEVFHQFCKENQLTYYMAGGTLLGAVRHKGFIPWDDDIDLMMPRPDYEKMIRLFHHDRYRVDSCETNPDYATPFARVWDTQTFLRWDIVKEIPLGVFIDIFPIDGYPEDEKICKMHMNVLKFRKAQINSVIRKGYIEGEKYQGVKKYLKYVWRKSANEYARLMNQTGKKYAFSSCDYVGVTTTTAHIFKERNPKTIFQETVYLPFQHLELPAPSGYDVYLKHLYGNYMQLPPPEQRVSTHDFKIYWR